MTPESVLALLVIYSIIGLTFTFIVYRFVYYRSKQVENKYFLYEVRDDLIRLAITGKLDEKEFLFKEMYPVMNNLINGINSFRFKHILAAIRTQESKVMDDSFVRKFNAEIAGKPPEVIKVFNDFFQAIIYIIYRNSLLFRILFSLSRTFVFLGKCMNTPRYAFGILNNQFRAYRYSNFYKGMIHPSH